MQKSPFKHMAPYDYPLFSSFVLTDRGRRFTDWQFDVCLGCAEQANPLLSPEEQKQQAYLASLKVDAAGREFGEQWIIEVKPAASLSAIGQVESYSDWWLWQMGIRPRKMIITDEMDRKRRRICEYRDIDVVIVAPANIASIQLACQIVNAAHCERIPEILLDWQPDSDSL